MCLRVDGKKGRIEVIVRSEAWTSVDLELSPVNRSRSRCCARYGPRPPAHIGSARDAALNPA